MLDNDKLKQRLSQIELDVQQMNQMIDDNLQLQLDGNQGDESLTNEDSFVHEDSVMDEKEEESLDENVNHTEGSQMANVQNSSRTSFVDAASEIASIEDSIDHDELNTNETIDEQIKLEVSQANVSTDEEMHDLTQNMSNKIEIDAINNDINAQDDLVAHRDKIVPKRAEDDVNELIEELNDQIPVMQEDIANDDSQNDKEIEVNAIQDAIESVDMQDDALEQNNILTSTETENQEVAISKDDQKSEEKMPDNEEKQGQKSEHEDDSIEKSPEFNEPSLEPDINKFIQEAHSQSMKLKKDTTDTTLTGNNPSLKNEDANNDDDDDDNDDWEEISHEDDKNSSIVNANVTIPGVRSIAQNFESINKTDNQKTESSIFIPKHTTRRTPPPTTISSDKIPKINTIGKSLDKGTVKSDKPEVHKAESKRVTSAFRVVSVSSNKNNRKSSSSSSSTKVFDDKSNTSGKENNTVPKNSDQHSTDSGEKMNNARTTTIDNITQLQNMHEHLANKCVKLSKEIKYLTSLQSDPSISFEDGQKLQIALIKLQDYLDLKLKEKYEVGVKLSRQLRKQINMGENGEFWIGTK